MESSEPRKVLTMAEIVAKATDPVAAIKQLGASLAKSQMMGPTDRVEIGETLVMLCLTEGWTLAELFRSYQISFGKLEKKIDAAVAEFLRRSGKIEWVDDGSDGKLARAKFTLGEETIVAACTVEEAEKAGWTKNPKWRTETQTMLRARTKKRGLVAICPDLFFGEYEDQGGSEPLALTPVAAATVAASAAEQAQAKAHTLRAVATPPALTTQAPSQPVLSDEMQTKVIAVIGENQIALAQEWAISVGWLKPGESLEQLAEKHAKSIIAKPEQVAKALTAFQAKKAGAK